MTTVTITDAKQHLGDLVEHARLRDEATVITKSGKEAAVLISLRLWEVLQKLQDRADLLEAEAVRDEPGEDVSLDQIKKDLGL